MFANFIDSADSRETSVEIMIAITYCAHDEEEAIAIWEDPSPEQVLAIWENVTDNGLHDSRDFCWGASEDRWAAEHGVEELTIADLRCGDRAVGTVDGRDQLAIVMLGPDGGTYYHHVASTDKSYSGGTFRVSDME